MIKNAFCQVNGLSFNYIAKGEGPLILFLHGFPEFSYSWRKQIDYFGNAYQAVAPDLRGFNLTDKPEGVDSYQIDKIISDIDGLAKKFTDKKFVLVAHDWGGAAAWAYALAHQDRLEKLVIINAPHPATFLRDLCVNEEQIKASQYMRFFRTPEAEAKLKEEGFEWLWRFAFGELEGSGILTEYDKQAYINAWQQEGALTGGLNWYRASNFPVPEKYDPKQSPVILDKEAFQITVPTLIIWGEKDHALRLSLLEGVDEYVSDVTIKRLPDAGHWVVQEFPEIVNGYIDDFIS